MKQKYVNKIAILVLKHVINILHEKSPKRTIEARRIIRLEIMRIELATDGKTE